MSNLYINDIASTTPELTETKDRIETKEPQPYWKLQPQRRRIRRIDGSLLRTGHAIEVGNMHPNADSKIASFVLMATLLLVLILDSRMTSPRNRLVQTDRPVTMEAL